MVTAIASSPCNTFPYAFTRYPKGIYISPSCRVAASYRCIVCYGQRFYQSAGQEVNVAAERAAAQTAKLPCVTSRKHQVNLHMAVSIETYPLMLITYK
jgi:hypothetical protein